MSKNDEMVQNREEKRQTLWKRRREMPKRAKMASQAGTSGGERGKTARMSPQEQKVSGRTTGGAEMSPRGKKPRREGAISVPREQERAKPKE